MSEDMIRGKGVSDSGRDASTDREPLRGTGPVDPSNYGADELGAAAGRGDVPGMVGNPGAGSGARTSGYRSDTDPEAEGDMGLADQAMRALGGTYTGGGVFDETGDTVDNAGRGTGGGEASGIVGGFGVDPTADMTAGGSRDARGPEWDGSTQVESAGGVTRPVGDPDRERDR